MRLTLYFVFLWLFYNIILLYLYIYYVAVCYLHGPTTTEYLNSNECNKNYSLQNMQQLQLYLQWNYESTRQSAVAGSARSPLATLSAAQNAGAWCRPTTSAAGWRIADRW